MVREGRPAYRATLEMDSRRGRDLRNVDAWRLIEIDVAAAPGEEGADQGVTRQDIRQPTLDGYGLAEQPGVPIMHAVLELSDEHQAEAGVDAVVEALPLRVAVGHVLRPHPVECEVRLLGNRARHRLSDAPPVDELHGHHLNFEFATDENGSIGDFMPQGHANHLLGVG